MAAKYPSPLVGEGQVRGQRALARPEWSCCTGVGASMARPPPLPALRATLSHKGRGFQGDARREWERATARKVRQAGCLPYIFVAPPPLGDGLGVRERGKGITPELIPAQLLHPALRATLSQRERVSGSPIRGNSLKITGRPAFPSPACRRGCPAGAIDNFGGFIRREK
jgi:hypothetical protein